MAESDRYVLPPNTPCAATLQAYQQYFSPLLDDYWHAKQYRANAAALEKWQRCCPEGSETIARLRFEKAFPERWSEIPVPSVFAAGSACGKGSLSWQGGDWANEYSSEREKHWEREYAASAKGLYDCCVRQFHACLQEAAPPGGGAPASAASELCLKRFAPEQQEQTAAVGGNARAQQQAEPAALPSGFEVIAGWPDGAGSFELALFGAGALLAGFICGRAGRRRRWARFGSRLVNAFFAGLVFLGIVALLPDTQPRSLLLALAGAIIATLLRLLVRSFFLLRQREQDAPVP